MREYLKDFSRFSGIDDMIFPERMPNTLLALAVTEFAREKGKLHQFRKLAMDAYWRSDLDLEAKTVLGAIAENAGLEPMKAVSATEDEDYLHRVKMMNHEAWQNGITGIPTFIIGESRIVGCQPFEVLEEAVNKANGKE